MKKQIVLGIVGLIALNSCSIKKSLPKRKVVIAVNSNFIDSTNSFATEKLKKFTEDYIISLKKQTLGTVFEVHDGRASNISADFNLIGSFNHSDKGDEGDTPYSFKSFLVARDNVVRRNSGVFFGSKMRFNDFFASKTNNLIAMDDLVRQSYIYASMLPISKILDPINMKSNGNWIELRDFISYDFGHNRKVRYTLTNVINNAIVFAGLRSYKADSMYYWNYSPTYRSKKFLPPANPLKKYIINAKLSSNEKLFVITIHFEGSEPNLIFPVKIKNQIELRKDLIMEGNYSEAIQKLKSYFSVFLLQQKIIEEMK